MPQLSPSKAPAETIKPSSSSSLVIVPLVAVTGRSCAVIP